jgi:hypothetical protein
VADPLGLAALNPDAAAQAEMPDLSAASFWIDDVSSSPALKRHEMTLVAHVDKPLGFRRWRFLLFWVLLKLAARVYKFDFEIYRNPKPGEDEL